MPDLLKFEWLEIVSVSAKIQNVRKFDIQEILKKMSNAQGFQRFRAVIRSRTIAGSLWRGKFEANETTVVLSNDGGDDDRR